MFVALELDVIAVLRRTRKRPVLAQRTTAQTWIEMSLGETGVQPIGCGGVMGIAAFVDLSRHDFAGRALVAAIAVTPASGGAEHTHNFIGVTRKQWRA